MVFTCGRLLRYYSVMSDPGPSKPSTSSQANSVITYPQAPVASDSDAVGPGRAAQAPARNVPKERLYVGNLHQTVDEYVFASITL
jgi:hypothetical protein